MNTAFRITVIMKSFVNYFFVNQFTMSIKQIILLGFILFCSKLNAQMLIPRPQAGCGQVQGDSPFLNFNPTFIAEREIKTISGVVPSEPGFYVQWNFDIEGRNTLYIMLHNTDTLIKQSFTFTEEEGYLIRRYYKNVRNNEEYLLTYRYNKDATLYQEKKFSIDIAGTLRPYETIYYHYEKLPGNPNQVRVLKKFNGKSVSTCDCFYTVNSGKISKYIEWEDETNNKPELSRSFEYSEQDRLTFSRETIGGATYTIQFLYDNNQLWSGLNAGNAKLRYLYAPNQVLKEMKEMPGFDGKNRQYLFSYHFYE